MILIALGVVGLTWGFFSYTTTDKVADVGPVHITHDQKHYVSFPPVAGAVAIIGGILLVVAGKKE